MDDRQTHADRFHAFSSAAYLHSFRETSQQRLNTMRVQTLSSLRNPGHLMRAGMNILTTQVNSLRDYCGVIAGHPGQGNYLFQQQQQQFRDLRYSPGPTSHMHPHRITTIREDDESFIESASLIGAADRTPYAGFTASSVGGNASGIGQLDAAGNSVLLALNNFGSASNQQNSENINIMARGQMSAGIGLFPGSGNNHDDDLINEPERLTIYGEQRPALWMLAHDLGWETAIQCLFTDFSVRSHEKRWLKLFFIVTILSHRAYIYTYTYTHTCKFFKIHQTVIETSTRFCFDFNLFSIFLALANLFAGIKPFVTLTSYLLLCFLSFADYFSIMNSVDHVRRAFRSKYSFDVQATWLQACLAWLRDQYQLADVTNSYSLERIYQQWLHSDLALIADAHCLPSDLDLNAKKVQLTGKYGLQVTSRRRREADSILVM